MKNAPQKLVDFLYRGNYYKISPLMLEQFIQSRSSFSRTTFDTANYHAILQSEMPEMIDYIEANINEYMTDVYLAITTNSKEHENELLNLLNNKEIKLAHLIKVITRTEIKVPILPKLLRKEPMRYCSKNPK